MKLKESKSLNSRNTKNTIQIGTTSRNELMEKKESNKRDDEDISNEKLKENKKINHNRIHLMNEKEDEMNSSISKRSSENKLLLKNNPYNQKSLDIYKDTSKKKIEHYTFFENNINKKANELLNFNETQNYVSDEDINKIDKNKFKLDDTKNEEENENEMENNGINLEEIFNLIVGHNIKKIIEPDYINKFFLSHVPEDRTLNMNINKMKSNTSNNSQNLSFNYNLEIVKNNQIYFFARIKQSFPTSNIKIYIKSFNNQYTKVGKIISNFLKNNFIVYKGNNKSNYLKILNIEYEINFFGNKMRKMKVEKFENNQIKYILCNELPEWDIMYNTYKQNFNGRVKQTSKKNFILKFQDSNDEEKINEKLLQCGKINDNCFALDFISPLSPFEAFSISITSIINKISCE